MNKKSPYFKSTTNEIKSIRITVIRDCGETFVEFLDPKKIKELLKTEPFFKELTDL